jgi:hypothetical protein
MDNFTQFRHTYLAAAPHSFYTGTAWILAALTADVYSKTWGIIFFLVMLTLTFPAGELLKKLFNAPDRIEKTNDLGKLFMLGAFTIPLSYPVIYFLVKQNPALFFPAFAVIVGAHYLIFVYGYRLLTFAFLASAMVGTGTVAGIYFPQNFSLSGYICGGFIIVTGIVNLVIVKREINTGRRIMTLN